jgi:ribosome-binding factor A
VTVVTESPRRRKRDESVKIALADILIEDVEDPRLRLVTITSVRVSPDLRHAHVYVTAHGDAARYKEVLAGLESAKGRLRSGLGRRVSMKYLPEFSFHVDESVDEGMRITEVLRGEYEAGRGPSQDEPETP